MASSQVTILLQDLSSAGEASRKRILDQVVTLLESELREQARRRMANEPAQHVLQPTALLSEFYLRIIQSRLTFEDRQHFLLVAARMMRNIVVDEARRFRSAKRGAGQHATALDFESADQAAQSDPESLIALNEALGQLTPDDERLVELRFFYGLTLEQTADAMGIEYETLRKRWVRVRRQLYKMLTGGRENGS
jgi:RNA polymerase sigma factor (TIGR02999 family)